MRIIDLHCYPSTQEWIDCQGPYVDALAKYRLRNSGRVKGSVHEGNQAIAEAIT